MTGCEAGLRWMALAGALWGLSACADESLSGYADPAAVYVLTEMDGAPVPARATIRFPEPRQIAGEAPCNSYSGAQTAPYPWFEAGPLRVTRRACPDLTFETAYLTALGAMQTAEVLGGVLILRSGDGREMVFRASPDQP